MSKLINADCMKHLPDFADNHFDLAIVDPPYGLGDKIRDGGHDAWRSKDIHKKVDWNDHTPPEEYFRELFRISKNRIIWGCQYYSSWIWDVGRIVWDKDIPMSTISQADIASCSFHDRVALFRHKWHGFIRDNQTDHDKIRIHPCQKPVQLYRWLLKNYAKPGDLILDTHVGSGSSLVACIMEGFDYIGYEIDKEYYDGAMKRIKAEQQKIKMFK